MIIGAQMYTVRELCRDLDGLDETLKKIADIGYTSVQLSGVCAYSAEWMAEKLRSYGISADITHFDYSKIVNNTEETIKFHDTMGCKYIGIGSNPKGITPDGLMAMKSDLKDALPKIIASGHKFMYHNHHFEFAKFNGKTFIELLTEAFSKEECGITLDTYWVQAGGADPAQWLRILQGRTNCVHFKDMVFSPCNGNVRMACIGEGNMNYDAIIKACEDTGVEFGYVEQDNCYGEDPIECLRRSYEYFKAQGLK